MMVPPHSAGASNFMGNEEQFQKFVQYYVARVKGGNEWVGGGPVFVQNPLPPGFEPGLEATHIMQVPTGTELPKDGKVQMYPCHSFEFHVVLTVIDPIVGKPGHGRRLR